MTLSGREDLDRRPAESRKQQIVQTVLDLVAEHGADAVSAQLIADAIGVSQPAVFRHFPSKEAIWISVMDWLEEHLSGIYKSVDADASEPGLIALGRMFHGHVALIDRHPALAKLVFSDHLRLQFPALQRRFAKLHERYLERLLMLIERAKSEGHIPSVLPSKDAATMFLCMIQGLGFQFAIARLPIRLRREADRVFALYLRAVGA